MSSIGTSIFQSYLSPSLSAFLAQYLPPSIPLDTLSRTPPSRLQRTALPNIGLIELVSAGDFQALYDPLYVHSFPRVTERERSDLIVERLAAQARGERKGLAPYRIVGIRDHQGEAIGAAQFSVLPVPPRRSTTTDGNAADNPGDGGDDGNGTPLGAKYAVPYLQYIYVRAHNRRQDMSEVLHTMVLAVAAADAALMDAEDREDIDRGPGPTSPSAAGSDSAMRRRAVPFTLFETEPPDHGDDHASRAYALERSKIHTSTGGMALVLRRPRQSHSHDVPDAEDEILSAHVQPGLEPSDPPLTLVWIIRPSPTSTPGQDYNLTSLGKALVAAYYQSLRDEGFPPQNIALAESIVAQRCQGGSVFQLMPLGDVRDFSADNKGNLDIKESSN